MDYKALIIWALAIVAVIYAPITGFWWNLLILLGAYSLGKDALDIVEAAAKASGENVVDISTAKAKKEQA